MGARLSSNNDYNRVLAEQPRKSVNLPNFQAPCLLHRPLSEELTIPDPVRYSIKSRTELPVPVTEQVVVQSSSTRTIRPNSPEKQPIMTDSAFIISRSIVNPNDRLYTKYVSSTFKPFRSVIERNGQQFLVEFEERIEKRYVKCLDETTQKTRLFEVIDRIPCRTIRPYSRNSLSSDFKSDQHSTFSPVRRDPISVPQKSNHKSTSTSMFHPPTNFASAPSPMQSEQQSKQNTPSHSSSSASSSSSSSLPHKKKARPSFESYNDASRPSISSSTFSPRQSQQSSKSTRSDTFSERSIVRAARPTLKANQYEKTTIPRLSNITNQNTTSSVRDGYTIASHSDRRPSYGSSSKKPRYSFAHRSPTKPMEYSLPNQRTSSKQNPSTANVNAKPSFRAHTPTVTTSGTPSARSSNSFDDQENVYDDQDENVDPIPRQEISSNQTINTASLSSSLDPFVRTKMPTNQHHYRRRPNVQAYDEPILNNPKFLQSKNPDYAPIPASIRLHNNNK